MAFQTVCMMITRSTAEPGVVRWMVRRSIYVVGRGSADRVLCEGSLTSVSSSEDPLRPVREALEAALAKINALAPTPEPSPLLPALCACGKLLTHRQADPDSSEWACLVPTA